MRHLFLLAGEPAVGKSSWIKENALETFTLSADQIRLMMEGPRVSPDGGRYISQKNDKKVWELLISILEERMKRGETVFIDATHSRARSINRYRKLAKKYRYRVTVINFHGRKTIDQLLEDNNTRGYRAVPEKVIYNIYHRLETMEFPGWVNVITPEEYNDDIRHDWTDRFDHIAVIGDIHGNYYTLLKLIEQMQKELTGETAWVFLGDYFDRGKFNAEVFRFMQKFIDNNFVIPLTGNHDFKWLPRYEEFINGKFEGRRPPQHTVNTFIQFKKAGITVKEVKNFYNKLAQLVFVKFGRDYYVMTHGGIPILPSIYSTTEDFIFGVGTYEDSELVDETFSEKWNSKYLDYCFFSIHGHRNIFGVDIHNTKFTYNLNGDAEYLGGELRGIIIHKHGTINEFRQKGLNPMYASKKRKSNEEITIDNILDKMTEHNFVKVKDLGNNTYAINFTNKAFRKKKWDDLTVKARGLFIAKDENGNNFVLARSYEKFFNLNEREETKQRNLVLAEYPAVAYKKYNGFLGLLSVDPRTNEFFITTKGSNKGDYVDMFKEVISPYLTDELKNFLSKSNTTMVFEVIHKNDPHIVDYGGNNFVVLLDIVFNELKERKFKYSNLVGIGKKFGFNVKEIYSEINSYDELVNLIDELHSFDIMTNEGIEGVVVEFTDGFKVKIKSNWYIFWKIWRGRRYFIDKLNGDKGKINQFKESLHSGEDFIVLDFMLNADIDLKETDIISIRKMILEEI